MINIANIEKLHGEFLAADPFPFVVIDDFLDPSLALALSGNFPTIENMDVTYHGLNERKGEHSNFETLSPDFKKLKEELNETAFIKQLEAITGFKDLFTIDDRYGRGLHQGGNNSFLDTHIDFNLHPLLKKQRRFNLIIFLSEEWEKEWGGSLQFSNTSRTEFVASITPKFNRAVIFICNSISYHGYNRIHCSAAVTRKSFYSYYFTAPEKQMIFHDTVFQSSANDSFLRKMAIVSKEFTKNAIKRMMYYSGLNKLLK